MSRSRRHGERRSICPTTRNKNESGKSDGVRVPEKPLRLAALMRQARTELRDHGQDVARLCIPRQHLRPAVASDVLLYSRKSMTRFGIHRSAVDPDVRNLPGGHQSVEIESRNPQGHRFDYIYSDVARRPVELFVILAELAPWGLDVREAGGASHRAVVR
jgi:hypothetical protein